MAPVPNREKGTDAIGKAEGPGLPVSAVIRRGAGGTSKEENPGPCVHGAWSIWRTAGDGAESAVGAGAVA